MTEAVKRLLDYCFNDLSLNRVGIYASTSNVKSRAVIERVGCSFEGNLRDYIRIGDIYQDASMYSMLAREFKKIYDHLL
jgi:RimJ/RimL family protein N-acetyltransferase